MIRIDAPDLGPVEDAFNFGTTRGTNPLIEWDVGYTFRSVKSPKPRVSESGSFRGNPWKAHKAIRVRKTDGATIQPWGSPRLDGKGDTLGVKRPSGARLTTGQFQLVDTGSMFRDAFGSRPELTDRNKTLTRYASLQYSAKQHADRPYMFGAQDAIELAFLESAVDQHFGRVL